MGTDGPSPRTLAGVAGPDISGFELANNPDGDQPGSRVASNPNSLALKDGAILVADAGANTMLRVEDGAITVVAVFPIRFVDEPPSPPDPEESPSATGASPDQSSTALLASPSGSPGGCRCCSRSSSG